MHLFKNGGDFDVLSGRGLTPLAYGSQRLLLFLSLEEGVTTVSQDLEGPKRKSIEASIGNNRLMNEKIFGA